MSRAHPSSAALLGLLVFFLPSLAHADPPVDEAQAGSPSNDGRLPRHKAQSVGVGYHGVFFRTETGDRYALHGPSVTYDYFVGRRWGFMMHAEVWFPLFGRMEGPSGSFRNNLIEQYPDRHFGFDLVMMAAYRLDIDEDWVAFFGLGPQMHSYALNGPAVSPIEDVTVGLGGVVRMRWQLHPVVHLGADLLMGVHPMDPVRHDNNATVTFPLAGSLTFGLRY